MLSTEEFKRCAQEYMDMVFRVAFSCLRSQADAEDVTQAALHSHRCFRVCAISAAKICGTRYR